MSRSSMLRASLACGAVAALGVASLAQARKPDGPKIVNWATRPIAKGALVRYRRILAQPPRRVATVRFGGSTHAVIVGPVKAGGFCLAVTGSYGGTACPLSRQRNESPASVVGDQSGPIVVESVVRSPRIAQVVIHFTDGRQLASPVLWVSRPIAAGFAYSAVPRAHRVLGHLPSSIDYLTASGAVLRRENL